MKRTIITGIVLLVLLIALAACTSANDSAAGAVQTYLNALVAKKTDAVVNASCAAWEQQSRTEVDSFSAVKAKINNLSCKDAGLDGEFTLVTCMGEIVATYGNEDQVISLEGRTYKAIQEKNDWRMCGYK
jgi:hypothetical protein